MKNNLSQKYSAGAALLGFCAIIAQVVMFRELIAVSLGNELAAGLIFAGWLLGVGAGSAAGGAVIKRHGIGPRGVAFAFIALAAMLPANIFLARALRTIAGYSAGEVVPLGALMWLLPPAAAPAAFCTGLAFAFLCAARANANGADAHDSARAPAAVYFADSAGSLAGGVLFSFLFVFLFSPMRLAGILWVAAVGVLLVCFRKESDVKKILSVALAAGVVFVLFAAKPLERASRSIQWSGQHVEDVAESAYASITAIRNREQISLFSNGRLAGTVPERVSAQFTAHVPLSLCERPRRVLLVGVGPSVVRETLKHGIRKVTVAELDPVLSGMRDRYSSTADYNLMHGPRVDIEITDARRLIMNSRGRFDAIIVRSGEPDTLLANRYFTREFYIGVKRALRPGGIFAQQASFKESGTDGWHADLLGTQLRTMRPALGRPILAAGRQDALLIARKGAPLDYDPAAAIRNFNSRDIKAVYFGPAILMESLDRANVEQLLQQPMLTGEDLGAYMTSADKIGYVFGRLEKRPGARENRDFKPVSIYYQTGIYSGYHRSALTTLLKRASNGRAVATTWLAVFAAVSLVILIASLKAHDGAALARTPFVAAAGFTGLAVEMMALFIIQIQNGNIYYYVGIVIAAFMLGGALGGAAAWRIARAWPLFIRTALMMCPFALIVLCVEIADIAGHGGAVGVSTSVWLMMAAAAGLLVGMIYSLSAADGRGARAGYLYAADHAGAAAGAVMCGVVLVPLIGIVGTAWICVGTLCAGTAALAFFEIVARKRKT